MTTTARETLARTIRDGWPEHSSMYYPARGSFFEAPPVRDGGVTARLIDYAVDVALEAAKPRTIGTVEELDALPYGAVVIHDEGWRVTVAQRQAEDMRWYVTGCLEYIRPDALLPATLLHVGGTR